MKTSVLVSGVSGLVGTEVVPLHAHAGHSLLPISRNAEKLKTQFPGTNNASFETRETFGGGHDAFLHLAVLNNEQVGSSVNYVGVKLAHCFFGCGRTTDRVSDFISNSTVKVGLPRDDSLDVQNKRADAKSAQANFGDCAGVIYLGLIHGGPYSRKLFFLNPFPSSGAPFFSLFSAKKPTTSINHVTNYPGPDGLSAPHGSLILTDRKISNFSYRVWWAFVDGVFLVA